MSEPALRTRRRRDTLRALRFPISSIPSYRAAGRGAARLWAALLCAALPYVAGLGCGDSPDGPAPAFSLLAVGDAGAPPSDPVDYERMLAVARALTREDVRQPADALLWLGDNFYPDGLQARALLARVRANLLRPLCRFVGTTGPRHAEVADACQLTASERHPLPIYAVLGNHDYQSHESPALQRFELPKFVENWRMPAGGAEVYEFKAGVSVVAFDSQALVESADPSALTAALRASRGPWRIVATHHPIATVGSADERARHQTYAASVRSAIVDAGFPVQLFVSGHEHRLAILEMDPPAPALHVISGGGSNRRKIRLDEPNARAQFKSLGFVRIDLQGEGSASRLVVSLYGVHHLAWLRALDDRRLLARWSVDQSGRTSPGGS